MNEKLLATARYYFAQSAFMSNCHYKANNRLEGIQNRNRKIVMWISGLTLIVVLLQTIGLEQSCQPLLETLYYCGMILTGSSLIYSMFNKEDISIIICQHKNIAEEYKSLRDVYMGLIEEIMSSSANEAELRLKRDKYQYLYSSIGKYAPATSYEDYVATQKGLGLNGQDNEEFTWSDKEIDKLLPTELRIAFK